MSSAISGLLTPESIRRGQDMLIKNGFLALPYSPSPQPLDILIEDGRITRIEKNLPGTAEIDAKGMLILPGGIDPHVHFYDPGNTAKEDFFHGTAFAASGGITTVIDMPCTSEPPVSNRENLEYKLNIVSKEAVIDFGFFGGVSRQTFDTGFRRDMDSLAGMVLGFKVYAISGMDDQWGALDHWRFQQVMEYARELDQTILLHAEDRELVDNATAHYRSLPSEPSQWYRARPELAEVLSVAAAIRIALQTGGKLHIVHVASAEAAELIAAARRTGFSNSSVPSDGSGALSPAGTVDISGETCPHYLAFDNRDLETRGAVLKVAPPIKSPGNAAGLWEQLKEGGLSFIASDHAPGAPGEKEAGDIWSNSMGISGTGTLLPYLFSEGYLAGRLSLPEFLNISSGNAARRFGLYDRKGSIEEGKDGDLVIINPDSGWVVDQEKFLSKGRLSPFHGRKFSGRIESTLSRGQIVWNRNEGLTGNPGYGRLVTRGGNNG